MSKVIAVVSGGMDSATLVARYIENGHDVELISFDYGQRHRKELDFAKRQAEALGLRVDIVDLTGLTHLISASALTGDIEVPEGHYAEDNMKVTVVPNRNAIMLSIAVGIAVNRDADVVATGVHAGDHFVYPDCRPEFITSMNKTAIVGNYGFAKSRFHIEAPFLTKTKAEIAAEGARLGVDYSQTWSCYKGGEKHCGCCGTCVERAEAFALAGVDDPTEYETEPKW